MWSLRNGVLSAVLLVFASSHHGATAAVGNKEFEDFLKEVAPGWNDRIQKVLESLTATETAYEKNRNLGSELSAAVDAVRIELHAVKAELRDAMAQKAPELSDGQKQVAEYEIWKDVENKVGRIPILVAIHAGSAAVGWESVIERARVAVERAVGFLKTDAGGVQILARINDWKPKVERVASEMHKEIPHRLAQMNKLIEDMAGIVNQYQDAEKVGMAEYETETASEWKNPKEDAEVKKMMPALEEVKVNYPNYAHRLKEASIVMKNALQEMNKLLEMVTGHPHMEEPVERAGGKKLYRNP